MSQNESDDVPRFTRPPLSFTDGEGRTIEIRAEFPRGSLCSMYETFSSASRAQGLPPVGDQQIQEWLDVLAEGLNVVAWDVDAEPADQPASEDAEAADQPASGVEAGQTERAVGHACLLDCGDGTFELSIFVHQDYQLAGIGSRLIRGLLGFGQEQGVKRVWLTVERSNHIAMSLYRSVGFESASAAGIEHEMELQLTS